MSSRTPLPAPASAVSVEPWSPPADTPLTTPEQMSPTALSQWRAEVHEEARAAGHAQGYAEGLDDARAAARGEVAAQREALTHAVAALNEASQEFASRSALEVDDAADLVASSAIELASALIGRFVEDHAAELTVAVVRTAVTTSASYEQQRARVHPSVAHAVAEAGLPADVQVVADPTVPPGSVELDAGNATLSVRLDEALAAAAAALR